MLPWSIRPAIEALKAYAEVCQVHHTIGEGKAVTLVRLTDALISSIASSTELGPLPGFADKSAVLQAEWKNDYTATKTRAPLADPMKFIAKYMKIIESGCESWDFSADGLEVVRSPAPAPEFEEWLGKMEMFMASRISVHRLLVDLQSRSNRCTWLPQADQADLASLVNTAPDVLKVGHDVGRTLGMLTLSKTLLAGTYSAPVKSYVIQNCCPLAVLPKMLQDKVAAGTSAAGAGGSTGTGPSSAASAGSTAAPTLVMRPPKSVASASPKKKRRFKGAFKPAPA